MPMVNASSSFGFDTAFNIGGMIILIAIAIGILAILFTVSADISKYRRFKRILKMLSSSFSYCAYGMLTVAVVGVPLYMAYIGINYVGDNVETATEIGKWIGIGILAFAGFTLVGYCTKNRVWRRIWKYHKIETQYKENMKELPKNMEAK